tara:strand:+ start:46 stop:282 length:237 start_codon:yes stop_codon:yes gene_type:complete
MAMIFTKKNFVLFLLLSMTTIFFYYTVNIFFGNYSFSEIRKLSIDLENLKNSNDILENENKVLFQNYKKLIKEKEIIK